MKADLVEGYYFRLRNNLVFYVKGVIHPPDRVIAYPKYIPDPLGDRVDRRTGIRYRKEESIVKQFSIVEKLMPNTVVYDPYIGDTVPSIPRLLIDEVYNPIERAREIISYSGGSGELLDIVRSLILDLIDGSGVGDIGVSGSVLARLYRESSDIDIVVYGVDSGRRVYEYLKTVVPYGEKGYRQYGSKDIERLYKSRSLETPIPLETLLEQERRRVLEGIYRGREYFIRLVRYPKPFEEYGMVIYRKLGRAVLKLRVIDASKSIYTPCTYRVETIDCIDGVCYSVEEVYSLRGRFNEIASDGDIVVAKGYVEELLYRYSGERTYRLYLGHPGDYMVVKSTI